jgi:hypothetical protein
MSSKSAEAYGILGKEIEAYDPIQKKAVKGVADSVFYKGEELMIGVGKEEVSMKNIHSVNAREIVKEAVKENVKESIKENLRENVILKEKTN